MLNDTLGFDVYLRKLAALTKLSVGWDGYHAEPISAKLADHVAAFIKDNFKAEWPLFAIVPASGDSIQIERHENGKNIEIHFWDTETVKTAVYKDGDTEIEEKEGINAAIDALQEFFK